MSSRDENAEKASTPPLGGEGDRTSGNNGAIPGDKELLIISSLEGKFSSKQRGRLSYSFHSREADISISPAMPRPPSTHPFRIPTFNAPLDPLATSFFSIIFKRPNGDRPERGGRVGGQVLIRRLIPTIVATRSLETRPDFF